MPYRYPEDTAIADVAIEVYDADTFEQALNEALEAMIRLMANVDTIKGEIDKEFVIEGKNEESLLFDCLDELVFLKDSEGLIFKEIKAKVVYGDGKLEAFLKGKGDITDINKHEIGVDVKAVTWHLFKVERKGNGKWYVFVILDI